VVSLQGDRRRADHRAADVGGAESYDIMRPNRSRQVRKPAEAVYDVVRAAAGWAVVRAGGGYREELPTQEAARRRACEICSQLAPAKVRVHGDSDAGSAPLEEIVYCEGLISGRAALR